MERARLDRQKFTRYMPTILPTSLASGLHHHNKAVTATVAPAHNNSQATRTRPGAWRTPVTPTIVRSSAVEQWLAGHRRGAARVAVRSTSVTNVPTSNRIRWKSKSPFRSEKVAVAVLAISTEARWLSIAFPFLTPALSIARLCLSIHTTASRGPSSSPLWPLQFPPKLDQREPGLRPGHCSSCSTRRGFLLFHSFCQICLSAKA